MFNFLKKWKTVQVTEKVEQRPCRSDIFSKLVLEEKALSDAALDLLISHDNLDLMGIGATTTVIERLNSDPLVNFVGDKHYREAALHLCFYRVVSYLTIYLAGRYSWDSVPSSVQQQHPNYLSQAENLYDIIISALQLYEKMTNQADMDKEHCRIIRSLVESILYSSSALDDNDFNRLSTEISNATTQFYRLLNLPSPVLKASIMMMCAVGAATYVICDRLLPHAQDDESREVFELRREHGLKCYTSCREILNDDYLAPLFESPEP